MCRTTDARRPDRALWAAPSRDVGLACLIARAAASKLSGAGSAAGADTPSRASTAGRMVLTASLMAAIPPTASLRRRQSAHLLESPGRKSSSTHGRAQHTPSDAVKHLTFKHAFRSSTFQASRGSPRLSLMVGCGRWPSSSTRPWPSGCDVFTPTYHVFRSRRPLTTVKPTIVALRNPATRCRWRIAPVCGAPRAERSGYNGGSGPGG